jgi:hypothetical protein
MGTPIIKRDRVAMFGPIEDKWFVAAAAAKQLGATDLVRIGNDIPRVPHEADGRRTGTTGWECFTLPMSKGWSRFRNQHAVAHLVLPP